MKIVTIMISINFGDFLKITAPFSRKNLPDEIIVVTASFDLETIKVCEEYGFTCLLYDEKNKMPTPLYSNVTKILNMGFEYAFEKYKDDNDVIFLKMDPDTLLLNEVKKTIAGIDIDDDTILGISRYHINTVEKYNKCLNNGIPDIELVKEYFPDDFEQTEVWGFFQLFKRRLFYPIEGKEYFWDQGFRSEFKKIVIIDKDYCLGLGPSKQENWKGRITEKWNINQNKEINIMQHYYQNIEGWFNFINFYISMVQQMPQNAKIVEIGAWRGTSTVFLGVEIINSGKNISLSVVDIWETYDGFVIGDDPHVIYSEFLENIKPLVDKMDIRVVRLPSIEAAKEFEDNSLDFVFIDAAHDFEHVCEDIDAWLPKVKNNGWLAGHDYHETWPGVIEAVNLKIKDFNLDGSVWYKQI